MRKRIQAKLYGSLLMKAGEIQGLMLSCVRWLFSEQGVKTSFSSSRSILAVELTVAKIIHG